VLQLAKLLLLSGRLQQHWRVRIAADSGGELLDSAQCSRTNTSSKPTLTCHLCLQNPCEDTCSSAYFGVSPPVRSGFCGGAANPLAHDSSWMVGAYSASCTNLQALRELDSTGTTFLDHRSSDDSKGSISTPDTSQMSDMNDWSDSDCGPAEVTSGCA
jgi:hypothetical protein